MKKNGILNSNISNVLSQLGHTDTIVIADCGLPIPDGVLKIDVSLRPGFPSFSDVFDVVCADMTVEKFYYANEMINENGNLYENINKKLNCNSENVSHDQLKELSKQAKAIIRTGDIEPYSNIILQAGVDFKELYENYCQKH